MTIIKSARRMVFVLLTLEGGVVGGAGEFDTSYNGLGFTRDSLHSSSRSEGLAIYLSGEIATSGNYPAGPTAPQGLVVWRHLPDGTLDSSFGGTGAIYPTTPTSFVGGFTLAIDNQSRLVLLVPTATSHVVYRFNFDGSPDLTFSGTGSTTVPIGAGVFPIAGVAIQSDNNIVAVGGAINPASGRSEFVVYRLLGTGGLDSSFGRTGLVYTQITPGGGIDRATGVALQPDGKIIAVGRARTLTPGSFFDVALARYLPTGVLDNGFGTNGRVIFSVLDNDYGRKVVIQPDGKIVITGSVCRAAPTIIAMPAWPGSMTKEYSIRALVVRARSLRSSQVWVVSFMTWLCS